MLNRNDYEKYEYYLKRKNKLWGKNLDQYNEEVKNLNESYGDYFKTIEEIDYIMENKRSVGYIIEEAILIMFLELLGWVPITLAKDSIFNSPTTIAIIFLIIIQIPVLKFSLKLRQNILCNIKYNKMMKG